MSQLADLLLELSNLPSSRSEKERPCGRPSGSGSAGAISAITLKRTARFHAVDGSRI